MSDNMDEPKDEVAVKTVPTTCPKCGSDKKDIRLTVYCEPSRNGEAPCNARWHDAHTPPYKIRSGSPKPGSIAWHNQEATVTPSHEAAAWHREQARLLAEKDEANGVKDKLNEIQERAKAIEQGEGLWTPQVKVWSDAYRNDVPFLLRMLVGLQEKLAAIDDCEYVLNVDATWKAAKAREAALKRAIVRAKVFIEYARYELTVGKCEIGDQFPKKDDATNMIAELDRALYCDCSPPAQPGEVCVHRSCIHCGSAESEIEGDCPAGAWSTICARCKKPWKTKER
jgi:hypothetical protein